MKLHRIEIEYCTGCRWLARAAWMAQELLSTFEGEVDELILMPGIGGIFDIRVNGKTVWSREDHGFPEPKEVKQRVRDIIVPTKDLGHNER
ncbi:MAG: SelT/SelW/SelH family protein [Mariprofundaceae bacterium]